MSVCASHALGRAKKATVIGIVIAMQSPKLEKRMKLTLWLTFFTCSFSFCAAQADEVKAVIVAAQVQKVSQHEFSLNNVNILGFSDGISSLLVKQYASLGLTLFVDPKAETGADACSEAVIILQASKGNFIPNDDGKQVYRPPRILSFTCINK
jgi:hypothetical protein